MRRRYRKPAIARAREAGLACYPLRHGAAPPASASGQSPEWFDTTDVECVPTDESANASDEALTLPFTSTKTAT
jgi:hypothetical protein